METRFITFESTRLAVHVAGRGPVAILLHGYPLDHRMWLDALQGPLAQQRTLVALDLRGHGLSPWCGDRAHTMELFADDVATVIHTLSDEPVDLVGLSMGGYAALAVMERHLATEAWFTGDEYGIADIALYAYTCVAPHGGIALDAYPALRGWLARVEATPGFVPLPAPDTVAQALIHQSR
mgnify:CR=1 FL=1